MNERLGATPRADGSCDFVVWAPNADEVELVLGDDRTERLVHGDRGYHRATVAGVAAGTRYGYRLDDGEQVLPDPASRSQPDGVHGRSAVVDLTALRWQHDDWVNPALEQYVIYELHVGTFTPQGSFAAIIPRLADLAELGITAIELLPVAQFPGTRNWGYDGVDLFAVQHSYGGPSGLAELVDAAHGHGIAIVLDVVYNHLGPEGNYLRSFGPYFSEKYVTPWGDAVNVDDAGSDEVRRFFVENAVQWVRDLRIDALRLDAIHGILDTSARPFLAELADAVEAAAIERGGRAWVIAESDLNDTRVIAPRSKGGLGHHAQWSDDFHHALHTALTGERDGYYADFSGLRDLATAFRRPFVYRGQYSPHRGRRHGNDASGLPGHQFVVYAQNHDQVGNRLLGDRLAPALDLPRRKVALAAVLLAPYVPMLFMGEEYGDTAPFPYFINHGDSDLVAAVRAGRVREFAAFSHVGTAPDPQGEETFTSAILSWDARDEGEHGALLDFTRKLLRVRRTAPSIAHLRPDEASVQVDEAAALLSVARGHGDEQTLVLLHFGNGEAELPEDHEVLLRSDDHGTDTQPLHGPGAVVLRRRVSAGGMDT